MLVRAMLAFLVLPGVVAFAVPLLLARAAIAAGTFRPIAFVLLVPGVALLLWCVREFYAAGRGTLAPWNPPRQLVTSGLYRYTRNPMYVAVTIILVGWAVAFASWGLAVYALIVAVVFHVRVVSFEEPWLARTHRETWPPYARRVPRWAFRRRRSLLLTAAAAVIVLPLAGLVYEAYADARGAREFPPPGMLVDVGGRRLHLLCIGEGQPIVFFESSGFGSSISSSAARERIAARTTVCSYDRRGRGWSDAAPGVTTVGALARDLAVLQDRAQLRAPYVIVAASIGGLTAEMYARQYSARTAGLVMLDASNSLVLTQLAERSGAITAAACSVGALAHVGAVRLLDPFRFDDGSEGGRRGAAIAYGARPWMQTCATARGLTASVEEFAAAPPLPADLPLTVLRASSAEDIVPARLERFISGDAIRAALKEQQEAFAKQSTRSSLKVVPDSSHLIASSQPDAVVEAVFEMLREIR